MNVWHRTWHPAIALLTVMILIAATSCSSGGQSPYAKGLEWIRAGKAEKAIPEFSALLEKNPADSASRFGLGWAYQATGKPDAAVQQYNLAVASAVETLGYSYFNLGVVYQQQKKWADATVAYQRAASLQPSNPDAPYNLAFVYREQGNEPLALAQFQETLRKNPNHVWAHYYAGEILLKQSKRDEAKKMFQKVVSLDPAHKQAQEKLKVL
jgi:tetratricopeptide (TPR) repeat protein